MRLSGEMRIYRQRLCASKTAGQILGGHAVSKERRRSPAILFRIARRFLHLRVCCLPCSRPVMWLRAGPTISITLGIWVVSNCDSR